MSTPAYECRYASTVITHALRAYIRHCETMPGEYWEWSALEARAVLQDIDSGDRRCLAEKYFEMKDYGLTTLGRVRDDLGDVDRTGPRRAILGGMHQ